MAYSNIKKIGCLCLVNELIPTEIVPLVWFSCISVTVYVFFRVFSSTLKEKFRQTNLSRKKEQNTTNTDEQIDNLIDNAPKILREINQQIAQQKSSGVTDDQMKGLYDRKKMIELVTSNQDIINLGKPVVKLAVNWVTKFMR